MAINYGWHGLLSANLTILRALDLVEMRRADQLDRIST